MAELDPAEPLSGVFPVREIVAHKRPHNDEQWSIFLLSQFGGSFFPGIENAPVRFHGNPDELDGDAELALGRLCVGCGKHLFDDKHHPKAEYCCADTVVWKLQISDPAVLRITERVRHADRTSNVGPFELPSLIKEWHRLHPPQQVFLRVRRIYGDLLRFERGERAPGGEALKLEALEQRLREAHPGLSNNRGFKHVLRHLRDCSRLEEEEQRMFDLTRLIRSWGLLYSPSQHQQAYLWAYEILTDAVRSAVAFQNAYDAYRPAFSRMPAAGGGEEITWTILRTDNSDLAKIARAKGADLVIVVRSSGNVQIFTRAVKTEAGYRPTLDMSAVVANLRLAEMDKRGLQWSGLGAGDLAVPGKLEACPNWYYLQSGEMVLNGSDQSSPDVYPTILDVRDEIVPIIQRNIRFRSRPGISAGAEEKEKQEVQPHIPA